jgi:hypothetical protein
MSKLLITDLNQSDKIQALDRSTNILGGQDQTCVATATVSCTGDTCKVVSITVKCDP